MDVGVLKRVATRALVPLGVIVFAYGHVTQKFFHWDCPVRTLTKHPCPTCGMTSAFRAIVRGNFAEGMHLQPLAIVVLPFVAMLVSVELGAYVVTGKFGFWSGRTKTKSAVRIAGFAMCAALFALWIARFFGAFGGPIRV